LQGTAQAFFSPFSAYWCLLVSCPANFNNFLVNLLILLSTSLQIWRNFAERILHSEIRFRRTFNRSQRIILSWFVCIKSIFGGVFSDSFINNRSSMGRVWF
jgi:hypothetical protein